MKIGIVYTSTTPELIEMVNAELNKQLGSHVEIMNYEDASILGEVRENGYVTAGAAARLTSMFMQATSDGAQAVLNCCSSVGEAADAAVPIGKYTGVPIVRIDEEMCRDAVRTGNKIGVLATLPTTLAPTKNTLQRVAREMGRQIELTDGLVDGAFGLNQEEFKQRLCEAAEEIAKQVDVILLCQGSMAYAEEELHKKLGLPVFSSPRYGAAELKKALVKKGVLFDKQEG